MWLSWGPSKPAQTSVLLGPWPEHWSPAPSPCSLAQAHTRHGGLPGLASDPCGLTLRPIQLFQPGLCVRGQAVPEPRQMYAQQAPVSAQCRFCSLSTSCTSHVASVLPTAAAGRGGWHHPHMGHPVGAGGLQAPSPHPCSLC